MRNTSRRTLDDKFSEGARRLWAAIEARSWTQAAAAKALEMPTGQLSKFLYGVRKPGREWAAKLHERLMIPATAWDLAPAAPFMPPAARTRRAKSASTPKKRRTPTQRPAAA